MAVQISIIIVNYNVKAFLEQCLYAVFKATKNIENEVFVIDNNSVDDSVEMLKSNFPQVKLICNHENMGFAYACNQALKISSGKYALLLNPDTIIKEDSLDLCKTFMDENPDAGALGVKMIDGKGKFLPESKRSLPTASSAFYKMFGLSSIFPKSKTFGKYQLKYLDENEIHQVEVLSGAFMFIRKLVLDQIGFLDEQFFMYGEDIDLSYRISKANYKNYYFPLTTIIHFKGESTKKASMRYVKLFYNAMLIFSNKHYKSRHQSIFRIVIQLAIYFRAALSILRRVIEILFLPFFDFLITYILYCQTVPIWENYKFMGIKAYSETLVEFYIPAYILIWLLFIRYFKGYNPFAGFYELLKAILWGTIIILVGYSLLPETYRFSRALILIGAVICYFSASLNRLIIRFAANKGKGFSHHLQKRALLIGNPNNEAFIDYPKYLKKEFEIVKTIKHYSNITNNTIIFNNLHEIINIYKIETIIFFIKDLPVSDIINTILHTQDKKLQFKMILPVSTSMVGSQSVINLDTLPEFRLNLISNFENQLKKRFLDLSVSIIFLSIFPVFCIKTNIKSFFKIIFQILLNHQSWVSYTNFNDKNVQGLPSLKPGVFSPQIMYDNEIKNDKDIYEINLNYAKNYKIITDLIIIFKALKTSLNLEFYNQDKQIT